MNILSMQGMTTDKVINPLGQIGVVAQHTKLKQDMLTLLLTRYGSVIGNPTYGSHLHEYLFDQNSETTIKQAAVEIENVLKNNYNFLYNIKVSGKVDNNTLTLYVNYSTLNSNLSTTLEFNIPLNANGGISYEW